LSISFQKLSKTLRIENGTLVVVKAGLVTRGGLAHVGVVAQPKPTAGPQGAHRKTLGNSLLVAANRLPPGFADLHFKHLKTPRDNAILFECFFQDRAKFSEKIMGVVSCHSEGLPILESWTIMPREERSPMESNSVVGALGVELTTLVNITKDESFLVHKCRTICEWSRLP